MNILFTDDAWEDYLYWQQTDKQTLRKINQLLKSRRIDSEHRLVYEITDNALKIIGCRFHY